MIIKLDMDLRFANPGTFFSINNTQESYDDLYELLKIYISTYEQEYLDECDFLSNKPGFNENIRDYYIGTDYIKHSYKFDDSYEHFDFVVDTDTGLVYYYSEIEIEYWKNGNTDIKNIRPIGTVMELMSFIGEYNKSHAGQLESTVCYSIKHNYPNFKEIGFDELTEEIKNNPIETKQTDGI